MLVIVFVGCKKDKFTTAPQITYKSIKPNSWLSGNTTIQKDIAPVLTIKVTDAEGDLGFIAGSDTSKIYVKNLLTNRIDSIFLPDISAVTKHDFQGDITVNLLDLMSGNPNITTRPRVDTLYFEVYIKDFAKNKSNVIKTGDPVYYIVE